MKNLKTNLIIQGLLVLAYNLTVVGCAIASMIAVALLWGGWLTLWAIPFVLHYVRIKHLNWMGRSIVGAAPAWTQDQAAKNE